MADSNKIQIWAELTLDNKKIKTEFTKAWEEAWKSVAEWLDKQQWTIVDKINETIDEIRIKIESLNDIDWSLVDPTKTEQDIQYLDSELNTLQYTIENLKYGWQDFWDEWKQAFDELVSTANEYEDTLYNSMDQLQTLWSGVDEAMEWVEEQTKETTEAVKELNETANQWISENGWLWKMLKFLSSKEIFNFFYKNIVKIWQKLVELSWDWDMLAEKWWAVQNKFEALWWYIGKWLTPVLEWVIEDANQMADELTWAGSAGQESASVIQKWVFIVATAFRWLIKIIRSFWVFLWSVFWWLRPIVSWFFTDLYDTAKSVIEWIWNVENWKALGNNIKYGIVDWVNWAIESVNWLLNWINDKLWIDLWNIKTFNAGQKQSFNFWDISLWNTKNAIEAYTKTMDSAMEDIWKEWYDFIQDTKQWRNDLWNTAVDTNKKIKDNTKKTVGWWSKDSVKWAYEELEEEAVDVWKDLDSMVEDHQKQYDKLTEEIEKVEKEYDKLREEAKKTWEDAEKSLKDYNDELEKSQSEAVSSLWERYVELKEDWREIGDYMKKVVSEISDTEWWLIRDEGWTYRGYDYDELKKAKEIYDEMKLIEENTTEEQRKSQEFTEKTSKAQEILNKLKEEEAEIENKKAIALEKQAIAQAMIDQEDWKQYIKTIEDRWTFYYDSVKKQREQVQNEDNIQYAQQLENKITNLNDQLTEFQNEKNKEVEILIDTTARKIELENEYQKVFEENVKKQQKELDNLIAKEQRLIDKRREYLSMWWSVWHNAYWWSILSWWVSVVGENWPETIIARQSSYVQPRNASNNYSTINNDNSFSINGINVNVSNMDEFLNELKEKLTYRS